MLTLLRHPSAPGPCSLQHVHAIIDSQTKNLIAADFAPGCNCMHAARSHAAATSPCGGAGRMRPTPCSPSSKQVTECKAPCHHPTTGIPAHYYAQCQMTMPTGRDGAWAHALLVWLSAFNSLAINSSGTVCRSSAGEPAAILSGK